MEDEQKPDMGDEELEDLVTDGDDLTAEELKAKLVKERELLKEAIQTKKNWRTKYEELQKSAVKPETLPTPTETKPDEEVVARISKLETVEQKRQFGYANGLSPEETDKAFAYAKGLEIKPEDALKDEFFKNALDSHRSSERQSGNTPRPSSRLPRVEGKTFEEMKPDEKRKNWAKLNGAKS
jgi:hypothetical protein